MDRNKMKLIFFVAAIVFLALAIVAFVLGISISNISLLAKILVFVAAAVCLALALELGYFTYLMMDTNPNYFLYDSSAKRNISVQKLTFAMVNAKMNRFLSGYAQSEAKIWKDRVLDNPYLEMPEEFKPLVAYKLLYGLAESDAPAGWACLEGASDDTLKFICGSIANCGDGNFANALYNAMAEKPANMNMIRDFLIKNSRYMQSRMMKYVVSNIDRF